MMRSFKYLAFGAALAFALSFSQLAHAAFLFYGTKRVNLENSPNDCLTVAIGTLNREAFANLRRTDNDVSGSRQNSFVVITCPANPAPPNFLVVIMAVGDDEQTVKFLRDRLFSLF